MSSPASYELVRVTAAASTSACELIESSLTQLESAAHGPCLVLAIISLLGAARAGKSTLGSSIVDMLRALSPSVSADDELSAAACFPTSSLSSPCTRSLHIVVIPWGEAHGRPAAIVVIDSPGTEMGSTRHEQLLSGMQTWLATQIIHVSDSVVTYRAVHELALTVGAKLAALQGQTGPVSRANEDQPLQWPSLLVVANKVTLDRPASAAAHAAHWAALLAQGRTMHDAAADMDALLRAYPASVYRTVPVVNRPADNQQLLIGADDLGELLDAVEVHPSGVPRSGMQWNRLPGAKWPATVASSGTVNVSSLVSLGDVAQVVRLLFTVYQPRQALHRPLTPLQQAISVLCKRALEDATTHFDQVLLTNSHLDIPAITGDEELASLEQRVRALTPEAARLAERSGVSAGRAAAAVLLPPLPPPRPASTATTTTTAAT